MNKWKRLVNMAVAYIRRPAGANDFEIVFRYQNPEIGVDRVFNFNRNISENVASTLNRIKTNIEKEHDKKLNKKNKKTKKGKDAQSLGSTQTEVDLLIEKNESTTWSELLENINDHNFKESKLKVFGQEFTIAYNYPYVSQLALPSVLLVGFDCYPAKFEVGFTERNKCSFDWYKGLPSENKNDLDIVWEKCEQNGFFYKVQQRDLCHKLKVIIESTQSFIQIIFNKMSLILYSWFALRKQRQKLVQKLKWFQIVKSKQALATMHLKRNRNSLRPVWMEHNFVSCHIICWPTIMQTVIFHEQSYSHIVHRLHLPLIIENCYLFMKFLAIMLTFVAFKRLMQKYLIWI